MKIEIDNSKFLAGKKIGNYKVWGLTLLTRKKRLINNAGGEVTRKSTKKIRADYLYDPKLFNLNNPNQALVMKIKTKSDLEAVSEWIFMSVDKQKAQSLNWPLNYVNRPLGKFFLRLMANNSQITPNTISVLGVGLFIIACLMIMQATVGQIFLGGILIQIAHSLDCVDGRLSRIRLSTSIFGEYLDSFGDYFKIGLLYLALAIGTFRLQGDALWLIIGLGLLLGELMNQGQIMINQKIIVTTNQPDKVTPKRKNHFSVLTPYLWMREYLSFYENRLMAITLACLLGVLPLILLGLTFILNLFWVGSLVFVIINRNHVRKTT